MIERPRSKFLSHRYPAWRGCTVQELAVIFVGTVSVCVGSTLLLSVFLGYGALFVIGGILLTDIVFTAVTKQFAAAKKGTPYHYLVSRLLYQLKIGRRRRITACTYWDSRRTLQRQAS